MLIMKVLRNYLHLQSVVLLLPCAINFTNAQFVQNFLNRALDFGRRFQPEDVFSSAVDASRGLFLSATRAPIPTPADFFDFGINFVVGYPTEQLFTAINIFCKFSCVAYAKLNSSTIFKQIEAFLTLAQMLTKTIKFFHRFGITISEASKTESFARLKQGELSVTNTSR